MGMAFNGLWRKVMKRDVSALTDRKFDIVVVGGGIYGAAIVWDAALRGLDAALIEKDDFGGNTSSNSLKIIHGGLRYLQQLDIKRVRESVRERRVMLTIAPHIVRPLSCVMPTYGHFMKGPEAMFCGTLLNDILSFDRNMGVDPMRKIPNCRVLSKQACLDMLPGIDSTSVNGGVFWTDAQMYSSERLLLAFVLSAHVKGAAVANYVEAEHMLMSGSSVTGIRARDRMTGDTMDIQAKVVVNAGGAWAPQVLPVRADSSHVFRLSTAMNLVVDRQLFPDVAGGVYGSFSYKVPGSGMGSGRRVLFATPWRGRTIVGTFHRPYNREDISFAVTREEVDSFLKEINSAVPDAGLTAENVTYVQKGFLPMDGISSKNGEVLLTKHYSIVNHAKKDDIDGLVSVVGVKYTTARDVAEKVMDVAEKKVRGKITPSHSEYTSVAGGGMASVKEFQEEVAASVPDTFPETVASHLAGSYGTGYKDVLDLLHELDGALIPGSDEVLEAEIYYAVREEAALKLSDAVLRRTDLGSLGHPGKAALEKCADIMAAELGWDESRKQEEIAEVESKYTQWA